MTRPPDPPETLAAWASLLFGEERAAEISPSLGERIGYLNQIGQADLGYGDEPATRYCPVTLMSPADQS